LAADSSRGVSRCSLQFPRDTVAIPNSFMVERGQVDIDAIDAILYDSKTQGRLRSSLDDCQHGDYMRR
jgi:hypothetical protein